MPTHTLLLLLAAAALAARNDDCALDATRPFALIPGAVKSGTTALHSALRDALGSPDASKELYHFNDDGRYAEGDGAYARRLGCGGGRRVDGSPMYLAHPTALARAAEAAPWATWVVLLREPVDRAYSHFNMLSRYGERSLKAAADDACGRERFDFGEAVDAERRCLAAALPRGLAAAFDGCVEVPVSGALGGLEARGKLGLFGVTHGLLSQSLYAPQLERAVSRGPRVLAVSQRALFDDGEATLARVFAALGVDAPAAPLKSYESLSGGSEAMAVRPNATYGGHRHRVDAALRADLDALFAGPNAALAAVLATLPAAIGFDHDAAWLPVPDGASEL